MVNKKITDFLKTKTPKNDLAAALNVIKEFKSCESKREWMEISFSAWVKLEQLEEYLEHLVNNEKLAPDTIKYIKE